VRALRHIYGKLLAVRMYWPAMRASPGQALKFLLTDPEVDNYTYDIGNLGELTDVLADSFGADRAKVRSYARELEEDAAFSAELSTRLRTRTDRKPRPQYGRRFGWYCIVRLLRPTLLVEAGVHDGLGSAVFLQALERNRAEEDHGRLIGIDVDPTCGWLVPDRLRGHFELAIDDSVAYVQRMPPDSRIDLFLHDSLHTYEHEMRESRAVADRLAPGGILLSDDAHATTALSDFSVERHRRYIFWRERPVNHFYPGAGIGMSLPG
jgi:predicted O-methyltransferase YrrM